MATTTMSANPSITDAGSGNAVAMLEQYRERLRRELREVDDEIARRAAALPRG